MRKPRLTVEVSKLLGGDCSHGSLPSELCCLPLESASGSQVCGSGHMDENYNETVIGQEMYVVDKKNKEKWSQ